MSETRVLVRCALGFILAVLVIVGGIFGFDVKVDIDDTQPPAFEEVSDEATIETSADSTPTEDVETSVDESVEEEVALPTDNTEDVATEGE
jgi:hypothetical protein